MRHPEDRILHGLYYYRQAILDPITVTGEQILWLAENTYRQGMKWASSSGFKSSVKERPGFRGLMVLSPEESNPLYLLASQQFIRYESQQLDQRTIAISVTPSGSRRAKRLHTLFGRFSLRYEEHKNGVLGLVITALVAIVTALATTIVTNRLALKANGVACVQAGIPTKKPPEGGSVEQQPPSPNEPSSTPGAHGSPRAQP